MRPTYLDTLIATAAANVARLAALGNWPASIDAHKSIVDRIPTGENTVAPGFDAGVACVLGLIPEDKQRLSAILHAAYTEEAIRQVRREVSLGLDTETAWWLAACSVCQQKPVDARDFVLQVMTFQSLATVPALRQRIVRGEFEDMKRRFSVVDGIPFITTRGGLQGAYFLGHDWGVEYKPKYSTFFVGTFRPSLGLEDFAFSGKVDEHGRRLSGPVSGSQQYVKCCSFSELARAIDIIRVHLG
jgi:hypothetical protein